MIIHTHSEVNKMYKSFIAILEKNKIPICNIRNEIYLPEAMDVELKAEIKTLAKEEAVNL